MESRAARRQRHGDTSAEQQMARKFDRWIEKSERKERLEGRLHELRAERDGLAEVVRDDPASKLSDLIVSHESRGGADELVPIARLMRLTGQRKSALKSITVRKGAHDYVPWEWALDKLAEERGYRDADALKKGIEDRKRDRERLAALDRAISHARFELSHSGTKRGRAKAEHAEGERQLASVLGRAPRRRRQRNPLSVFDRIVGWLRG